MVRLKESKPFHSLHMCLKFQFQYGSIKSNERLTLGIVNRYFNSNMVRLKEKKGLQV